MGKKPKEIRSTQTKVKHQILEAYLKKWGSIIFWGIKTKAPKRIVHRPHFVYIDAFSSTGKFPKGDIDNPNSGPVYGSPIIGIRQLDQFAQYARNENFPIRRNVILVEKNVDTYRNLLNTLDEVGVGDRVRETTDFSSLRDGEIAVANEDVTKMGQALTDYTNQDYTWAFYLLDPYGGSGIPYDFVQQIVSGPRHDVMINFVYLSFLRDLSRVLKSDEKLSVMEQSKIDTWARVFGEERWMDVDMGYQYDTNAEYGPGMSKDEATQRAVMKYGATLQDIDSDIAVKTIALQFPEKERTMLYLFLTTHDPTGALAMNEVLHEARLLEKDIRSRVRIAKRVRMGESLLPGLEEAIMQTDTPEGPRPETNEIENELMDRLAGQKVTLKQVYHALVDTDFFPSEVKKAIRSLRRKTLADFTGNRLTNRTRIVFRNKP